MTKGARAERSRIRRLLVAVSGVCVLAAVGAPTAAALSELTESRLPVPEIAGLPETDVTEATGEPFSLTPDTSALDETAGPVLAAAEASADGLPQTTENLAQAAAPTLARSTETLAQATGPVLEPVQQSQLLPETVDTLAGVIESAVPPAVESLPLVEAVTEPRPQRTLPPRNSVRETPASPIGIDASDTAIPPPAQHSIVTSTPELRVALSPSTTSNFEKPIASTRRALRAPLRVNSSSTLRGLPSVPSGGEDATGTSAAATASPVPRDPVPFAPGSPLSGLASASASAGAGALLLAALAATLLLAAPGLGRRLRPKLAPWPQPIPQLSLERPG